MDPVILRLTSTVKDARRAMKDRGCGTVIITDNGRIEGKIAGIVTTRDVEPLDDEKVEVQKFMTPEHKMVCGTVPMSLRDARILMCREKVGKLPMVTKAREVVSLLCRGDLKNYNAHPNALVDLNTQLRVAAALGAHDDNDWDRAQKLVDAGVDTIFMDIGDSGVTEFSIHLLKRMKEDKSKSKHVNPDEANFAGVDVIVGPVSSWQQAQTLLDAGADGLRVGGLNSFRYEATAIYQISRLARKTYGAPIIADIGPADATQAVKALCLGASAVMVDKLLEGTDEAPGDHIYQDGARVKVQPQEHEILGRMYGHDQCALATKAITQGSVIELLSKMIMGLKATLQVIGVPSLRAVGQALALGSIRLERQMSNVVNEAPRIYRGTASALHNRW